MMIVGIYLIVNGIKDYAEQSRQNDWTHHSRQRSRMSPAMSSALRTGGMVTDSRTYYTLAYTSMQ